VLKKCEQCGEEFEAVRADARFCTAKCRVKSSRSVTEGEGLSVTRPDVNVTDSPVTDKSVTDNPDLLQKIDVAKDLHLSLEKDLGITGWTADGIFIRPDITVAQVRNIARLVHAKHSRPCPVFNEVP
jgi:hypothetical protein